MSAVESREVMDNVPDELLEVTQNVSKTGTDEENNDFMEVSASHSKPSTSRETPHSRPDWLENLRRNFDQDIIQVCSNNTKTAVENNKKIEVICNI